MELQRRASTGLSFDNLGFVVVGGFQMVNGEIKLNDWVKGETKGRGRDVQFPFINVVANEMEQGTICKLIR